MSRYREKQEGTPLRSEAPFICCTCGRTVACEGAGTHHRNHCPHCLHSIHLDNQPGDRAANCGGIMEPVGVWVRKGGEWAVIHRCRRCGVLHSNRVAADDSALKLISLAVRPLAEPPFPLELCGDGAGGTVCPTCRAAAAPGANYCPICGASLADAGEGS